MASFPGDNARSWEALGEARPGQSSLSAGALRYRAWAQSWSSAALPEGNTEGPGAGESPLLSRSGGEKGLRGSGESLILWLPDAKN